MLMKIIEQIYQFECDILNQDSYFLIIVLRLMQAHYSFLKHTFLLA